MRIRSNVVLAGCMVISLCALGPAHAAPAKAQEAMDQFAAAWAKVNTYTCTLTAREIDGTRVQDRVYQMFFQKPHDTRLNITGGDGKGSVAIWHGGDTVQGHQGGFLSMVKLNLNIHAHLATSIRGTTIADSNWGALYDHLTGLKSTTMTADVSGDSTTVTVPVPDPSSDGSVTQEVVILGKDGLPTEYDQYVGGQQVKHVIYSDVRLNVDIPASTWSL